MPLSVRLDNETEDMLEKAAGILKTTKSNVIKESLHSYCLPLIKEKRKEPHEFVRQLIEDCPGSGDGNLSVRAEEIIRERLRKVDNPC